MPPGCSLGFGTERLQCGAERMNIANPTILTNLLINGQMVPGEGPVETILNPATGKVLAEVPEASHEQVSNAVKAASRAFETWSQTTPGYRAGLLLKVAD